jgi:hypothetical protein
MMEKLRQIPHDAMYGTIRARRMAIHTVEIATTVVIHTTPLFLY